MALLAFKAIDYGADHIPDRFWEKLPGGFFTPADKKKAKHKNRDGRTRRELPHSSSEERRAHRDTNPPTDYSDFSAYDDTDHEREYRDRQRRRRAKSVGQSPSREINYGRGRDGGIQRSSDFDDVYDMDRSERAPQFPPPPASEYKPYNPADYAPPMGNEYGRRSSARPEYGYAPQPSALHPSTAQARYTPAGYSPSPIPPPGADYNLYQPREYEPPVPEAYSPQPAPYKAPGNSYPSPPPLYRHRSRSQPSITSYEDNQLTPYYEPPSRHDSNSSSRRHRHDHDDGKRHRAKSAGHRRGRSRGRVADKLRERFEHLDLRDRLHDKHLTASVGGALAGGLAGRAVGKGTLSTLVGAAIVGFGGSELEKRREKKKAARGASPPGDRHRSRSRKRDDYSRSPSRDRHRHDYSDHYDSYSSDSEADHRRSSARRRRSSRRSRRDDEDRF